MVYQPVTYSTVGSWTPDTCIEYTPNAKKVGTKSAERYARYSKARTMGEALILGSKPEDLLHDFEKGFLREAPEAKGESICVADASSVKQEEKPSEDAHPEE